MTTYGPTPTGFRRKRADEIMADIKDYIRSPEGIGPNAPVDDSPFEELLGCFVADLDEGWQALEATYDSFDPDAAQGSALDNLLALTGLLRLEETPSIGVITVTGDENTEIPAGFEVKNSTTDARFVTTEDVRIEVGEVSVDIPIASKEAGPISSGAGSIDAAVTVIAGVASVTNADAVIPGRLLETDPEARIRREKSLQVLGRGTVGGITADLLQFNLIQAVRVIENDTPNVVDGQDPWTVRSIVWPELTTTEDKETIASILWSHYSGIRMLGAIEAVATEPNGQERTVRWDWAAPVDIYVDVTLTTDSKEFPGDGLNQVRLEIYKAIDDLQVGDDVRVIAIYTAIDSVPGVVSADVKLGTTPSPTSTSNIVIDDDEVRRTQLSYITVA